MISSKDVWQTIIQYTSPFDYHITRLICKNANFATTQVISNKINQKGMMKVYLRSLTCSPCRRNGVTNKLFNCDGCNEMSCLECYFNDGFHNCRICNRTLCGLCHDGDGDDSCWRCNNDYTENNITYGISCHDCTEKCAKCHENMCETCIVQFNEYDSEGFEIYNSRCCSDCVGNCEQCGSGYQFKSEYYKCFRCLKLLCDTCMSLHQDEHEFVYCTACKGEN